jgi:Domain of unknown function (DUF4328)
MTDDTGRAAQDPVPAAQAQAAQEFLPLRPLAHVLTVLLAGGIALDTAILVLPMFSQGTQSQAEMDDKPLVVLSRVVLAATGILFLVWLHRARINAERSSWRQRHARAWVILGWIIPIVNLWIPFQLMGDIWRAGLPPARRTRVAWLPALWWASWLLTAVSPIRSGTPAGPWEPQFPHSWPPLCLYGSAGLTLIAIIKIVSTGPVGEP